MWTSSIKVIIITKYLIVNIWSERYNVIIIVTVGEYVGCYGIGCLQRDHNVTFRNGRMNSPNNCITACEDRGFAFAATVSGMECSCSCPDGEQGCLGRSLEDSRCGFPCVADRDSFCGGYMTISLYKGETSGH